MITGSLEEYGAYPRTTEWTVPDFFQLPKHVGFACYSKEFSFMDVKCRLATQPHGSESLPNIMIVALCLLMDEESLQWELEIRRANDTLLRRCTGCKEQGCEMGTSMYIPIKDFEKGCSELGFLKIICRLYNTQAFTYYADENKNYKNVQTDEVTSTDKLSCDMEELMLREDFCDLTIKVEDREFRAHKAIFGVRSPVFMNMFKYQMYENITGIVEIDDCDAITFREFMRYLYASRTTKVSPKVLFPLHQVADKYQVSDLKAYCLEMLKSNMCADNFCDSALLCFQYVEERLMNMVVEFLAEHMTEIKKTEDWKTFESENPEEADTLMQEALKYQKLTCNKQNIFQKIVKVIVGGR